MKKKSDYFQISQKNVAWMANSVDPDQTAPLEAVWSVSTLLRLSKYLSRLNKYPRNSRGNGLPTKGHIYTARSEPLLFAGAIMYVFFWS